MEKAATLERAKLGSKLIVVCIATTVGTAVPLGYNIGVVNAPAEFIRSWCNESLISRYDSWLTTSELSILWSSIVSIFLIGGAVGSLGGAWAADHLGRKKSLLACATLYIASSILFFFCRMANSIEMLLIARFIVGLASGLTTSTLPMYMAEISPLQLRGSLGVLCSMGITSGLLVGQTASLEEVFGTADLWHVALSAYVVLVIVCMLPYYWFPESPKYIFFVLKDHEAAREQLETLRGSQVHLVNEEIKAMRNETVLQERSWASVVRDPKLLLPVLLVCAFEGGQQLSGINAVSYYSVSIFESAGLSTSNSKWANLGIGCISCLVALCTPYLMAKVNRRTLAIQSILLTGVMLVILTIIVSLIELAAWLSFVCIPIVFIFVFAFQSGLGPITSFIGSELFESAPRPAAMALGSLTGWVFTFIVAMTFPSLLTACNAFVFLPFAACCFLLAAFVYKYLPETRGRNVCDIALLVMDGLQSKPNKSCNK